MTGDEARKQAAYYRTRNYRHADGSPDIDWLDRIRFVYAKSALKAIADLRTAKQIKAEAAKMLAEFSLDNEEFIEHLIARDEESAVFWEKWAAELDAKAAGPVLVDTRTVAHAAHHPGHPTRPASDLTIWTVRSVARPTAEQLAALGVPVEAEYHSGSLRDGVQTWDYTRSLPALLPTCERCDVVPLDTPLVRQQRHIAESIARHDAKVAEAAATCSDENLETTLRASLGADHNDSPGAA